jgi:hypothetical protein
MPFFRDGHTDPSNFLIQIIAEPVGKDYTLDSSAMAGCVSSEAPVTQMQLVHTVGHTGKEVFNPCACFQFIPVSFLLTVC